MIFLSPVLQAFPGDETGMDAVDDVVERIGGVVCPVHDLALHAAETVEGVTRGEFRRHRAPFENEVEIRLLVVVEEMTTGRFVQPHQGFVLHHPIDQGAGGLHTLAAGTVGIDHFREGAQGLGIALKAPELPHALVQDVLSGMPERRMPEIMRQAYRLHQVRIDVIIRFQQIALLYQVIANGAPDLSHFDGMGQAGAIKIILPGQKHLGLGLQPPQRGAVDDPVAVALERGAVILALARLQKFAIERIIKVIALYRHPGHGDTCISSRF